MANPTLYFKVDVDTDRGTRIGVPNLLRLFAQHQIHATFLFSLGPDNTGRAIKRIFRPGFLRKAQRTNVLALYGLRTLLNGVLWPGPHIGQRNAAILRQAQAAGHEVGIHCYDHVRWQDGLAHMSESVVHTEWHKATAEFTRIFGATAQTAGTAGWQTNAYSLAAYDAAQLLYGSDCRGEYPFFPRIGQQVFATLQIPTTLPTLDECLGLVPATQAGGLPNYYLNLLQSTRPNVLTLHAELEGMSQLEFFNDFLVLAKTQHVQFGKLSELAQQTLQQRSHVQVCELILGTVPGRSGTLAVQDIKT